MIAMDLVRFLAMASVPIAHLLGLLSYGQLLVVSVVSGTASIAFTAASGAYLKHLVHGDQLLVANGRFEGTSWVATAAGPPLGGALIGLLGPVVTVVADAVSYLLSALAVLRIRGGDVATPRDPATGLRGADLLAGWRIIRRDHALRRLFLNAVLVGGLIMATVPLLSVLLLDQYHFPAWQYGLAFGVPALGGFVGARLCARLVARYGQHRVMIVSGWLRSLFPLGLAFTGPGVHGLLTVIVVEGLLITCMGVFNPICATERLRRTPADHAAQVLSTWSVGSRLVQAALMVSWGAPRHPHQPARRDHRLRRPAARHAAPAARPDGPARSRGRRRPGQPAGAPGLNAPLARAWSGTGQRASLRVARDSETGAKGGGPRSIRHRWRSRRHRPGCRRRCARQPCPRS